MSTALELIENAETPTVLNGLPVPEIRAELDRILKSRVFVHSHRIRRFLQFVVEECLTGRQHRLKEYLIGLEVFNRQEDFDPRVDSIVRVEARRLRMKIDEYYQKEGRHNDIRIELRKGSYVPIFAHRGHAMTDGYPSYPHLARRHSVAFAPFTFEDRDHSLVPEIRRKLAHELIQGANFRVLADPDGLGPNAADGDVNGKSPKPDYVLEGRLERGLDGLRIALQLKHVGENAYVWSDSGDEDSIHDLATSLNRAMVTSLGRVENGRIKPRLAQESFDYYLQGRYSWKQGAPDSIRNSVALFEQAVTLDPSYAAAWACLAEAYMTNALLGLQDAIELGPKMKEAAQQAIHLAPALPEAYVAQGLVECALDGNWQAGERSFQRAIQLDPRDSTAHTAYGVQLATRGMLTPALTEVEAALELDPASLATHFVLGWLHGISGRPEQALAQHSLVSRLAPDFALAYIGLGWVYLLRGAVADALAQFTNARNLFKGSALLAGCLGHCYGRLGQKDEAMRQLSQTPSLVSAAAIYCGLGDTERALASLEQAVERQDCSLPVRLLNPEFEPLRAEPRFKAVLQQIARPRNSAGVARPNGLAQAAPVWA